MIALYNKVKLITSSYSNRGVERGSEGYIIENHKDGNYDVEFSRVDGETIAIIILTESEFELLQ